MEFDDGLSQHSPVSIISSEKEELNIDLLTDLIFSDEQWNQSARFRYTEIWIILL